MTPNREIERRAFAVDMEVRATDDDAKLRSIVGHAAVFSRDADIGGWFLESVEPGAFARAIVEDDVRSLFNHEPSYILGRNRAGTLKLQEDERGLLSTTFPPDTSYARDLLVSIERGDVSQMSFAFRVLREEWDETGDVLKRKILEVELFDVSPVTYPAYVQTDVGLRAVPHEIAERRGLVPGQALSSSRPLAKVPALLLPKPGQAVARRLRQRLRERSK